MQTHTQQEEAKTLRNRVRDVADRAGETVKEGLNKAGEVVETAAQGVRDALDHPFTVDADGASKHPETVDTRPDGTPPSTPELYGATDRGKARASNEDQFFVAELDRFMRISQSSAAPTTASRWAGRPQGWILMVADGVGGTSAGEMASEVTINTMADYAFSLMPWSYAHPSSDPHSLADGFKRAVERCQQRVLRRAETEGIRGAPATTLTAAYVTWPKLHLAHVGDSRCYVFRDGKLIRLTQDQTYAAQMQIDHPNLGSSVLSNVLLNAVGGSSKRVWAELRHLTLQPNDIVLLCTDGVTRHLEDDELEGHLEALSTGTTSGVGRCIQGILATANQRGGEDNLTAVIGKF